MQSPGFYNSYFSGFKEVAHFKENNKKTNFLAVLKIFSYFTVLMPIGFGVVKAGEALINRVTKKQELSPEDEEIVEQGKKLYSRRDDDRLEDIQIPEIREVLDYPGDLSESDKVLHVHPQEDDYENILAITFDKAPYLQVSIRREDLFESGAEVIVNAANTHLGGGGGIDGAIHKRGGARYKAAHQKLRKVHNAKYVNGYAAMIDSGELKEKHNIDNVIVVAGPRVSKGKQATPKQQSELYSCYYNSLVLAEQQQKTSIAFPSISTGIFNFPQGTAAAVSLKAIYDFINDYPETKLTAISIHFLPTEDKAVLDTYFVTAQ